MWENRRVKLQSTALYKMLTRRRDAGLSPAAPTLAADGLTLAANPDQVRILRHDARLYAEHPAPQCARGLST